MGARCAACLQPIVGKGFVIADTEVMHHECAVAGAPTVTKKLRSDLSRNSELLANARERAREAGDVARKAQNEMLVARKERDAALTDLRHYKANAEAEYQRANLHASEVNSFQAALRATIAEREAARRDLASAKTEIAVLRGLEALGPNRPTETTETKEERNPTEVRFSLLEID